MKCDSCGAVSAPLSARESVRWEWPLSWPSVRRRRVTEHWCPDCVSGVDPGAAGSSMGGGV